MRWARGVGTVRLMRWPGWKRALKWGGIGVVALFVLIQAVPYGRSHRDPPVQAEPRWDSPRTRELAARACFDCHSNLTTCNRKARSLPSPARVCGNVS